MQKIVCYVHRLEINIPTSNEEFLLGKMHDNICQLQLHHKEFPYCKFFKIGEKL